MGSFAHRQATRAPGLVGPARLGATGRATPASLGNAALGALLGGGSRRGRERPDLGHPPDPYVRAVLQTALGRDVGDVRVHSGPRAASLLDASGVGADAVAAGRVVAIAPEHDRPQTPGGRVLLLHELVHVLQQQDVAGRGGSRGGAPVTPQVERSEEDQAQDVALALARVPPLAAAPAGHPPARRGRPNGLSGRPHRPSALPAAGAPWRSSTSSGGA